MNNAFESGDFDRKLYWSERNDFVLTPHSVCSSSIVLPIDDSSIYRNKPLQESQRPKSLEFGSLYSAPGKSLPFEQDDEAYMSGVA
jgi:hypothetical protein